MITVFDVARFFIENLGEVTTMKLQKLVYYAQSWSLAWDDEPLFEEDFEAWANGPASPEFFREHRGNFVVGTSFLEDKADANKFNQTQLDILESVLKYYGDKHGQI